MTKFLALNISVSEDGFMAGVDQSVNSPLGLRGELLHSWAFVTEAFKQWHGESGGSTGIDNEFIERGFTNIGATIMGRNMFGPIRGEWPDESWHGWWGENPGYKHPVFVLTHYPRRTLDMGNGTVFHFVTGGIDEVRGRALEAANGRDVRIGGGAQTIQQFMAAGLLNELHVARVPIELNAGELLFSDPPMQMKYYRQVSEIVSGPIVHQRYLRN